ncbi:hypothetical protein [Roseibium sp. SCP14]|uniref:hypothetical protein n=1 Tax=Roseibium sp. SCP14 TaxID=3141375 RepID=UPI003337186F
MLKYFFSVSGRNIWLQFAAQLEQRQIAIPCLWIGDPRLESAAKSALPDCDVIDFDGLRYSPHLQTADISVNNLHFLDSGDFHRVKDNAAKMMDRIDTGKSWSRLDREAAILSVIFWGVGKINKHKPNFFFAIESPHVYTSYILYELCRYYNIPTFTLGWFPLSGGLYLRKGINDQLIPYSGPRDVSIDLKMWEKFEQYAETVCASSVVPWEPSYMRHQKTKHIGDGKRYFSYVSQKTRGKLRRLLKPSRFMSVTKGYFRDRSRLQYISSLQENIDMLASEGHDLQKPFAYFPLQYEPERTTNPDGLKYTDQIQALAALRDSLPEDFTIYVREHPSQLYSSTRGFLGRSLEFYRAIKSIQGVQLLRNDDISSAELIKYASITATISGTAALEAALIGKKSLLFGHSWFSGCPNVANFDRHIDLPKFIAEPANDPSDVREFLRNRFVTYTFPGYQNPSQKKLYPNIADDPKYQHLEIEGLLHSVAKDLIPCLK